MSLFRKLKNINEPFLKVVTNWFHSTNHKDIVTLYFILGLASGIMGTLLSLIIRFELVIPGNHFLYDNSQLYNVVVTAHAVIMAILLWVYIVKRRFLNLVMNKKTYSTLLSSSNNGNNDNEPRWWISAIWIIYSIVLFMYCTPGMRKLPRSIIISTFGIHNVQVLIDPVLAFYSMVMFFTFFLVLLIIWTYEVADYPTLKSHIRLILLLLCITLLTIFIGKGWYYIVETYANFKKYPLKSNVDLIFDWQQYSINFSIRIGLNSQEQHQFCSTLIKQKLTENSLPITFESEILKEKHIFQDLKFENGLEYVKNQLNPFLDAVVGEIKRQIEIQKQNILEQLAKKNPPIKNKTILKKFW